MKSKLMPFVACCLLCTVSLGQWPERTIHLGDTWRLPADPVAFAYNSRDRTVFIGGLSSDSVLVLDERTIEPVAWIDAGAPTSILTYCPWLNKLYAVRTGSVSVFDAASHNLLAVVPMPVEPSAACLDSEDNKLYVASEESACVAVLDCSRDSVLTILRSLRPSRYAQTVCYVPGWGRVYCCDYDDSSVVVIDCKADTILARVRTPPRPTTLCYNDANGRVYVLTEEDGGPVGIDVASNVVVSNADCFGATPLCCNARDNKLYGLHGSQKVGVYDCSTDSLVASVHTMGDPVYLLYSPSAHKVYCASIYG